MNRSRDRQLFASRSPKRLVIMSIVICGSADLPTDRIIQKLKFQNGRWIEIADITVFFRRGIPCREFTTIIPLYCPKGATRANWLERERERDRVTLHVHASFTRRRRDFRRDSTAVAECHGGPFPQHSLIGPSVENRPVPELSIVHVCVCASKKHRASQSELSLLIIKNANSLIKII